MIIDSEIKLHNKPFEEMELTELYAERVVRRWHRSQTNNSRERLKKRQWWLEQNMPIPTAEELKEKYENGELTFTKYRSELGHRKQAIDARMRNEDRMDYAERIVFHEQAVVAYLDELIAQRLAEKDTPYNNPLRAKKYDPRKRTSEYNYSKLDKRRSWRSRRDEKLQEFPKLQKARARWKNYKSQDAPVMTVMKRMQPVVTWDVEKLMQVARDRGYFTGIALITVIAEALNISVGGAKMLLSSGKLSWSQCIIIGAVLEVTPKEFCDIFLSGYFKEVADGVFKAQVDDIEALLDAPYRAKPRREEAQEDEETQTPMDGSDC